MMRVGIATTMAVALIAAPALAYKLVPHGQPIAVAKSPLTVVPAIDWNRMQKRPGRNAESWTLDGIPLNEITFYGGIADNESLFREVNRRDKPLPRFAATMLAPDVVQLFESSYRLAGGSALFTVDSVAPAMFAGQPGFRFTYGKAYPEYDEGGQSSDGECPAPYVTCYMNTIQQQVDDRRQHITTCRERLQQPKRHRQPTQFGQKSRFPFGNFAFSQPRNGLLSIRHQPHPRVNWGRHPRSRPHRTFAALFCSLFTAHPARTRHGSIIVLNGSFSS